MNRKAEFTLGMIGGILGVIASIWSAYYYYDVWNFSIYTDYMYSNHIALFLISVLGIVGASLVRTHSKYAAACMIISAILGFILSSSLYTIPGILLVIAGGISLYRGYGHDTLWAHNRDNS